MNCISRTPPAPRHRFTGRRLTSAVAILAGSLLWAPPAGLVATESPHTAPLPRLFLPAAASPPTARVAGPPSTPPQRRSLGLNPEFMTQVTQGFPPPREFRLDLLENQDVTVHLTEARAAADGALELTGTLVNLPGGMAHLVVSGESVSGVAEVPGLGTYHWQPTDAGTVVVTRQPSVASFRCLSLDTAPSAAQRLVRQGVAAAGEPSTGIWDPTTEPVTIDVLILYTRQVLTAHGDEASLRQSIQRMVDSANASYTNSLIGVRLNPVFVGQHDTWTESGNMGADFFTLFGDARATALRNDYQADFVYLIIESDSNGYSGAATLLGNPLGDPNRNWCILRRTVLIGNARWAEHESLTFTHETGHLLGAGHDREHGHGSGFQGQPPAYSFGNGHRFTAGGITYRTAMSYDPGVQLSLFSNPNLSFDGVPMGVPAGQPGEADNARTMNLVAPVAANYRVAHSRIGFAQPQFTVREGEPSATVRLERRGDLNTATRVTVDFSTSSTARSGVDYRMPTTVVIPFATNQAVAEIVIPILQDDLVEGTEVIQLGLSKPVGDHGIDQIGTAQVLLLDDEPNYAVTPSNLSLREGESADVTVEFLGRLDAGEARVLEIALNLDGSAATFVASADPESADGTLDTARLEFTAETRTRTLHLTTLTDALEEADEIGIFGLGNARLTVRVLDSNRPGSTRPVTPPNASVISLTALPSGGALMAGDFTRVGSTRRTGLARLAADGTLDPTFTPPELVASPIQGPGIPSAKVITLTPLGNGDWLAGGFIGLADGQPGGNLVRLNPQGGRNTQFQHPGFDGAVWCAAEQSDGGLLVGGIFDHLGTNRIRGLARLLSDGTLDPSFVHQPGAGGAVVFAGDVEVLPDGRILVGGLFEEYHGVKTSNLIRLEPDGTVDPTFPLLSTGASGAVYSLELLPDGRVYVAGFFEQIGGRPFQRLARLQADGSLDLTFKAPQPNGEVVEMKPLPNGQLLVCGSFSTICGVARAGIALLNEDGTVDPTFDLGRGANSHVWTAAVGGDGALFLGGPFDQFNEQPAPFLARLRAPAIAGALGSARWGSNGQLEARIYGLPGARFMLESSTDLLHWQPAGEARVDRLNQAVPFTLPMAGPSQFLRLKP
ncbi:MAG: hypothetical protein KF791_09950 [Verrucomicrobiae bacterium]|nr:hypothetical protein [Verrucomicrobiae bacterium]